MEWYFVAVLAAFAGGLGGISIYFLVNWRVLASVDSLTKAVWARTGQDSAKKRAEVNQDEVAALVGEIAAAVNDGKPPMEALTSSALKHPNLAIPLARQLGLKL